MDICSGVWYGAGDGSPCPRTQHLRNAICKVQRQKQRPTAARICKAVRQCVDSVSIEEITEWLNAAVRSGDILLINNDGVISYREPRRNLQNLTSPTLRSNYPPPVSDLFRQSECAWNFPPRYEPFREFMTQPVNRSLGWTFAQPVPYDPYVQFGDRTVDQYSGWLGSFSTADPQLTLNNDPVQYRFHQCTPDHSLPETPAKCLQGTCDENRNRQDCSYGLLQSTSDAEEHSFPSASGPVTSDSANSTKCSQLMEVDMTDSGINSSCEEHRSADDNELMSCVSQSTNMHRLSVVESPGTAEKQQITDEADGMLSGATTEERLDEVSVAPVTIEWLCERTK